MSKISTSYRQSLKSASVFGGAQLFNILILLIRSKIIAVLLGPVGLGIMGLLQNTISLVSTATSFGLGISAVREISEAENSDDKTKLSEVISILKNLIIITGIFGLLITAILSPILSKATFGNFDYTWEFVFLSFAVLFTQFSNGSLALLQGFRKIKILAKVNIYASSLGLLFSLPLYYFYGNQGIVPSMILTTVIVYFINFYFSNKIKIRTIVYSFKSTITKGRGMLKLGFMLSLSSLLSVVASYAIRLYISNVGSVAEVGLYSAGFTIVSTYVGLVFTAMGTDYFPQLSAINNDLNKASQLIQQQAEIALIILAPLICIFMVFIDEITLLIYSKEFLPISGMIHFAMLGIIFKAVSWSISFLFLARADSKIFLYNETATHIYSLLLNIIGYHFFGLKGLGIGFLIGYFVYLLQVYLVCKWRYGLKLNIKLFALMVIYIILAISAFYFSTVLSGFMLYLVGGILIIIVTLFSLYLLNRRIQIFKLLNRKS